MGGFKIMKNKKNLGALDFEDDLIFNSYSIIRSEFLLKGFKQLIYFFIVLVIIVIYSIIIYPLYLRPDNDIGISTLQPKNFNFTINWTIFSIGTFLIFYIIKVALTRNTTSLKEYIKHEISSIGFKIQQQKKSWILFFILNCFSILYVFLLELELIDFKTSTLTILKGCLITYLTFSLIIPLLWLFLYDRLAVKLKGNYKILIEPYFRILKKKIKEYHLIALYLRSNKLAFRFNKYKERLYISIAENRWLPRKKKSLISKYGLNLFMRFYEFSTPLNLQNQFLNIVLALQDWEQQLN